MASFCVSPRLQRCSTCLLYAVSAASTGSLFHSLSPRTYFPQPRDRCPLASPRSPMPACTLFRILTIFQKFFFLVTEDAARRISCRPMGPAGSRLGRIAAGQGPQASVSGRKQRVSGSPSPSPRAYLARAPAGPRRVLGFDGLEAVGHSSRLLDDTCRAFDLVVPTRTSTTAQHSALSLAAAVSVSH